MRFLEFDEAFCETAAECGLRSFQVMAGALDGKAVKSESCSPMKAPLALDMASLLFGLQGRTKAAALGSNTKKGSEPS